MIRIVIIGEGINGAATQPTRITHPLLFQWWPTVYDAGSALKQQWVNVLCLLGSKKRRYISTDNFFFLHNNSPHFTSSLISQQIQTICITFVQC